MNENQIAVPTSVYHSDSGKSIDVSNLQVSDRNDFAVTNVKSAESWKVAKEGCHLRVGKDQPS